MPNYDHRWAIIIDLRDAHTGKRRRKWHSFKRTKRKAQDECARLVAQLQGGTYLEPAKTPAAEFLDHRPLDLYSHVMPGMQEDAAAKVAALLRP